MLIAQEAVYLQPAINITNNQINYRLVILLAYLLFTIFLDDKHG